MKFRLLIIILFFTIFLIENVNSVGESGEGPKLYKSFDEIFGKGWDNENNDSKDLNCRHVKEEVQDGQAPITSDQKNIDEILKQKFDEIYDENWPDDEDNSAPDQNESIDQQQNESNECEKIVPEQQKREIVEEFIKMNDEYKQKGKHSRKEWNKYYIKISKSVGVGHNTIKKWKKEFGLSIKLHSKQEKMEKLKEYCEIKKGNPKIKDFEIADGLNIGRSTLGQWKMELKNAVKDENNCSLQKELDQITPYKIYSELEKRQILKQFDEIKRKCKKANLKNISMRELDKKIAKKLGVSRGTITEWKRKFGLSVSNKISDATKIGILEKYAKIKGNNPKMSNYDIADLLKISSSNLCRWKARFKEEIKIKNI